MSGDELGYQVSGPECELNCPPLPVSAIDSPPALLATAMDPAALPVSDGANTTLSAAVCPGANVVLAPAPLAVNPAPVTSTLEIVTFAFPLFLTTIPSELLLPTSTLPQSRLLALELSTDDASTALPLWEIASTEFGPFPLTLIDPVAFPAPPAPNPPL